MICRICFDKLTKVELYDLSTMMKFTMKRCGDCRWENVMADRPLLKRDEPTLRELYYEGNTKKEKLVW